MITYLPDPPSPPNLLPQSPTDFFKRFPVRRALTELGPNDANLNVRMAESLLTISAEHFVSKWNFDPIKMRPKPGRFIWTPVKTESVAPGPKKDPGRKTLEDSLPAKELCRKICRWVCVTPEKYRDPSDKEDAASTTLPELAERLSPPRGTEAQAPKPAVKSTPSEKPTLKTRQSKITEFGRLRKRLHSKSDDEGELSPPSKKLLLDSEQRTPPAATPTPVTE